MRVFAISDLHLSADESKPMDIFGAAWDNYWDLIRQDWDAKVTENDIVLIAGDISWAMRLEEAVKDLERIAELKGTKVIIRGNHDYWWQSIGKGRAAAPAAVKVIQNDAIRIGEYIVCGTRGWTVPETGTKGTEEDIKLYEREKLRMEMSLKAADNIRQEGDKVIAMIHYPPFNSRFEDSGFTKLFEEHRVDAVVYGHLHGAYCRVKLFMEKKGISYYLTSCDLVCNQLVQLF